MPVYGGVGEQIARDRSKNINVQMESLHPFPFGRALFTARLSEAIVTVLPTFAEMDNWFQGKRVTAVNEVPRSISLESLTGQRI